MSDAFDIVVIGSGGAGLSAAVSAAEAGARVVLLERSDHIGGTTAFSGGMPWIPGSRHFREIHDRDDLRDDASLYIRGLVQGRSYDESLIDSFLDAAPRAIDFLQTATPLRMRASRCYTDYFADRPGGAKGGRSLIPEPFGARDALGDEWFEQLEVSPHFPNPLTLDEMAGGSGVDPRNADAASIGSSSLAEVMRARVDAGVVTNGRSLVAALLAGALDLGVEIRTGLRLKSLSITQGVATGVVAVDDAQHELPITAGRGVILASGGFEWNRDLVLTFLGTNSTKPLGAPGNQGDGLVAALAVGAATANMSSGWNYPVTADPTKVFRGVPLVSMQSTRFEPGSIAVNSQGQRFVNEGAQYADICKAFLRYDEVTQTYPNGDGAWLVFDQEVRDRAVTNDMRPGESTPDWVFEAPTVAALAANLGIAADVLETSIADFNSDVDTGVDSKFGRGSVWFEGQSRGGPSPESALARIDRPPFYAMRLHHGLLGTAGGLRIDGEARVHSFSGEVIPGLYACGNVAASPFGAMYPGGGTTIGLGLTFGYQAGRHASRNSK